MSVVIPIATDYGGSMAQKKDHGEAGRGNFTPSLSHCVSGVPVPGNQPQATGTARADKIAL
jgi:hypothetical protein